MSAKSQSTCDRRTTHHARVSDISASKSLTQVVNHLGSCTDELFTFLDNPALDSDHELRDLALEYKDSCCYVLEFCTTLRKLATEVDWFIHELERTVRHMERLWDEAASAGEHGDRVALFREGVQRQWPQGVQNAHADMYNRVMVQISEAEKATKRLSRELKTLEEKCGGAIARMQNQYKVTCMRRYATAGLTVLGIVSSIIEGYKQHNPGHGKHMDILFILLPLVGTAACSAMGATLTGSEEDFGERLEALESGISIAQWLKEAIACIRSENDMLSKDLKDLELNCGNFRRAATCVTEGSSCGHTATDARNMVADLHAMKAALAELSSEKLKEGVKNLEDVVREKSRNMSKRLDVYKPSHAKNTFWCTIM